MKRIFLILSFLAVCLPAYAKSYICRSDGSIQVFENGEEMQLVKPLRQNEVEEMPLPAKNEASADTPATQQGKDQSVKKRSDFVPLTQKDIEARSQN